METLQLTVSAEELETFLEREGEPISHSEFRAFNKWSGDSLPVIYLHNGLFSWCIVVPNFVERFLCGSPDDPHPPLFYLVKKEVLYPLVPGLPRENT